MSRIAKLNEIHELANVNTETVATLQYMSPEAMSQSIYTTASDIYAFGIVAYEILFEEQAFSNMEGFQLIDAVVNKQMKPVFPSDFERDDVKDILQSCWNFNPLERPPASKVCRKLMKILKRLKKKSLSRKDSKE